MKNQSFLSNIKRLAVACLFITTISVGNLFYNITDANAVTQTNASLTVAMESNIVDEALGSGTTDKIQGKAEEDLGTVQKKVGNTEQQIKGSAKQVKGRAKQDIGKVKNQIDKASSELEETSENVIDAVKNLFD